MTTAATITLGYIRLIQSGQEPANPDNFVYRGLKMFYDLGDGNFQRGANIYWGKQRALERENLNLDDPFTKAMYKLILQMSESDDPKLRALVNNIPLNEISTFGEALQREILEPSKFPGQAETKLPEIEDPTDKRIWNWVKEDLSITDTQLAQKLKISRQAVNTRRKSLEKMGYIVRVSRQKK